MKTFNKRKIIFLIIMAVAIGLIYFLPNILVPHFYNQETGGSYGWKDMSSYDFEEMFSYGVSIRDVFDGHTGGGDPYLWEYKDMPTSWDYYPLALIIGLFYKLFRLADPSLFFVIGDFIFPPISFIIIFFLFFRITKNFLFGAVSSLIFLFFPNLFIFGQVFSTDFYNNFTLLKITDLFVGSFNGGFSRLFVPALTMIFFSTFLLFLHKIISTESLRKRWMILCGISYGLLFYIYFYYWVFATISLSFLSVFLLFYKRDIFWRIIRVLVYGLVISIPYWIRFFVLAGNPIYGELTQRIGSFYGRAFVWPAGGYWLFLSVLIFFGIIFRKRFLNRSTFFYILTIFLAVFAVKNLQIIAGFNPQPDHWGSRVAVYINVFTVLILIHWLTERFLGKYKKSSSFILLAIIVFLGAIAAAKQITASQTAVYDAVDAQSALFLEKDILDSFKWLNKNTDTDSVLLTDSNVMRIALPFYTHANVYIPQACLSLASNSEILERYMEAYAIYGVPAGMLRDFFEHKNEKKYSYVERGSLDADFSMFCLTYHELSGNGTVVQTGTPESVIDEFMRKYKIFKPSAKNLRYRADYLFYGPYERVISNFNASKYPELELVYSNSSVKIYKILK